MGHIGVWNYNGDINLLDDDTHAIKKITDFAIYQALLKNIDAKSYRTAGTII
jgi:hypothetical protein